MWYLVLFIREGLPADIWPYQLFRVTDYCFTGPMGDRDPWIRYPDICYYLVFPFATIAASLGFAWTYRKIHPVNVTLMLVLVLLQALCSAMIYHQKFGQLAR